MRSPVDPELDALMARLAEGDRSVFSEVFQRIWPSALRLCVSLSGNEDDAADAAQQAMVKIFERASDYDKTRPALSWALAIAAWECRTVRRWRQRRREAPVEAVDRALGSGGESLLIERDLLQAARTALGELSEIDRETLLATFAEAQSSAQGATLRKRKERAIGRLRAKFRRLYGIDD